MPNITWPVDAPPKGYVRSLRYTYAEVSWSLPRFAGVNHGLPKEFFMYFTVGVVIAIF